MCGTDLDGFTPRAGTSRATGRMDWDMRLPFAVCWPFAGEPPAIIGEKTTAFPRNVGWHMEEQTACTKGSGLPRKLSDITIHAVTEYHTKRITQGAQPSCIENWHIKLGLAAPYSKIPFKKIFKSFGTPLSDPTEERQWRKLVHRATYVRNRNPKEQSHVCRLCRKHEESILNLFQCQ